MTLTSLRKRRKLRNAKEDLSFPQALSSQSLSATNSQTQPASKEDLIHGMLIDIDPRYWLLPNTISCPKTATRGRIVQLMRSKSTSMLRPASTNPTTSIKLNMTTGEGDYVFPWPHPFLSICREIKSCASTSTKMVNDKNYQYISSDELQVDLSAVLDGLEDSHEICASSPFPSTSPPDLSNTNPSLADLLKDIDTGLESSPMEQFLTSSYMDFDMSGMDFFTSDTLQIPSQSQEKEVTVEPPSLSATLDWRTPIITTELPSPTLDTLVPTLGLEGGSMRSTDVVRLTSGANVSQSVVQEVESYFERVRHKRPKLVIQEQPRLSIEEDMLVTSDEDPLAPLPAEVDIILIGKLRKVSLPLLLSNECLWIMHFP
jgi:hypothetical protein